AFDEEVILRGEIVPQIAPDIEKGKMRAEGLIKAEGIEIDAQCFRIDRPMGCRRHAVYREQPTGGVNLFGDHSDIVEAADDVGAVAHGEEARAGSEQRLEANGVQETSLGIDLPFADDDAEFGQAPPGPD